MEGKMKSWTTATKDEKTAVQVSTRQVSIFPALSVCLSTKKVFCLSKVAVASGLQTLNF